MDVLELDHVTKRYRIGERLSARETIMRGARRAVGRRPAPPQEILSLDDVSFTLREGSSLGVVGRNGAGKSTLLKVLAGITSPTSGVARTRGRVASMLEVGTGFHPELTGRENVYLNGAILGMSRRDIARHFDEIVEFSGVERFLDTPVKRFSSGMYLRLAFAVAAHLEPDILIVDEVLAVGDAEFQRKCIGRMHEAEQEGRTLLFVSHDLESLSRLCHEAIWLESGRLKERGTTAEIVRNYLESSLGEEHDATGALDLGPVTLRRVRVSRPDRASGALMAADPLRVTFELEVQEAVPGLDLAVFLTSESGVRVFDETLSEGSSERLGPGAYRIELDIPPFLNAGTYSIGLWGGTEYEEFFDQPVVGSFTLHGGDPKRASRVLVLRLPFEVTRTSA